ncbi:MAG TPA: tape measure protein, partial [Candidatus Luteimonas excrementigallinarum]|nr:tape measure protein [Candidatus Luteimonas excrementigallinarum]
EWTNISARVRLATESTEEFEMVQERLGQIADTTYRRYGEAADQFASSAHMMRELGFSTEQTLDSAEALGLALVAGGADAQRGASAMSAWTKAIALGRIDTEKWTTLMEQTPRVAQALAEGLGKTTVEMTAMARAGQLTADTVVPALIGQMDKLRAEVDSMPTEFQDAVTRAGNALLQLVGSFDESTGATAKLVAGVEVLVDHMDLLGTVAVSGAIGVFGSRLVTAGKGATEAARGFMQARDAQRALTAARVADAEHAVVETAMQAQRMRNQKAFYGDLVRTTTSKTELAAATRRYEIAARSSAQATAAHRAAMQHLDVATKQAAASKGVLAGAGRAALGILGGPTGLALTLGLVAAGWITMRKNTDEAESALANWNGTAAEAVEQFRALNREQRAGALLEMAGEIEDANDRISRSIGRIGAAAVKELPLDAVQEFSTGARELSEQFEAGAITADEHSRRIADLANSMAEGREVSDGLQRAIVQETAAIGTASREVGRKRGTVDELTSANRELEASTNAATGAMAGQAAQARASSEAISGFIEKMSQQIRRGGLDLARIQGGSVAELRREFGHFILDQGGVDAFSQDQLKDVVGVYRERRAQLEAIDAAQRQATASTRALTEAQRDAAQASAADLHLERMNQEYGDLVESLERQIALHGELGRAAAMAYDLANGALSGLAQAQKDFLQESAEWLDFLDDMAALEGVWAEVARDHAKYGEDAKQTLTSLEAFADQAARNMQTALGDNLYNILDGRFTDIGDAFSNMLKRMAAEMMASEIWRALGTALSGATGGGWWAALARGVGAAMQGKAAGGLITGPGTGTSDSIPAYLSNGEYVIKADSVQKLGVPFLDYLNTGRYASGGLAGSNAMVSPLMQRQTLGGGQMPTINVHIEKGASEDRVEQPRRNGQGGLDIRVMVKNMVAQSIGDGSLDAVAGSAWGVRRRGIPTG